MKLDFHDSCQIVKVGISNLSTFPTKKKTQHRRGWAGGCQPKRIGHLGYMLLQVRAAFERHPSTHGFTRSDPSFFKRHMTRHFEEKHV